MKILIGGSPCTHWSIAQTKNHSKPAASTEAEYRMAIRIGEASEYDITEEQL